MYVCSLCLGATGEVQAAQGSRNTWPQPQLSPDMAQPAMDQFLAAAFKYTSSAVSRYAGRCLSKIAAVTYPILSSYR